MRAACRGTRDRYVCEAMRVQRDGQGDDYGIGGREEYGAREVHSEMQGDARCALAVKLSS
jgi:hypothetical protein